jgi:acetyl esterase/lipase
MHLLWNLISAAQDDGKELAVFFLGYKITPEAQYPEQLKQAASALHYLTESEGRSPSDILLGGDSAGGNLALALLSHTSHPHAAVEPLRHDRDLRGTIILSPWVTFEQDSTSMRTNSQKDVVDAVALKTWSDSFMNNAKNDYYTDPKSAPASWWDGLKVGDICLMAGRDELFVDDIEALAETMKVSRRQRGLRRGANNFEQVSRPSLELFVAQGEAHDEALMGYVVGTPGGQSEQFFRRWVLQRLR